MIIFWSKFHFLFIVFWLQQKNLNSKQNFILKIQLDFDGFVILTMADFGSLSIHSFFHNTQKYTFIRSLSLCHWWFTLLYLLLFIYSILILFRLTNALQALKMHKIAFSSCTKFNFSTRYAWKIFVFLLLCTINSSNWCTYMDEPKWVVWWKSVQWLNIRAVHTFVRSFCYDWLGVVWRSFFSSTALLCVARACVILRFIWHFNVALRYIQCSQCRTATM